jgi:hypothetical protein
MLVIQSARAGPTLFWVAATMFGGRGPDLGGRAMDLLAPQSPSHPKVGTLGYPLSRTAGQAVHGLGRAAHSLGAMAMVGRGRSTLPGVLRQTRMKPLTCRGCCAQGRAARPLASRGSSCADCQRCRSPLAASGLCGDHVVLAGDKRDDVVAKRFELAEVVGQRPDEHALRSACGVGADAFGALLG